jgi:hypothetical protein
MSEDHHPLLVPRAEGYPPAWLWLSLAFAILATLCSYLAIAWNNASWWAACGGFAYLCLGQLALWLLRQNNLEWRDWRVRRLPVPVEWPTEPPA